MKNVIIALFLLLVFVLGAQAAEVTLQWDPNVPTPDGYRLFQRSEGETYNYAAPVWTGTGTTVTLTLSDGAYAWVVRAYSGELESGDSNEVVYIVEPKPPTLIYPGRPKQLIINFE